MVKNMEIENLKKNLARRGFGFSYFETGTEAAAYVASQLLKAMTKKGGLLYAAKQRTSQYYKQIDAIQSSAKTNEEKMLAIRPIKYKMIQENGVTVNAVEEYIRKYIKGTPALYKKIFG